MIVWYCNNVCAYDPSILATLLIDRIASSPAGAKELLYKKHADAPPWFCAWYDTPYTANLERVP